MNILLVNKFKIIKNQKQSLWIRFTIILFCSCITGCFYSIGLWGEELNALDTDLDRELRLANSMNFCLSSQFINERMSQINIKIIDRNMAKIFQHYFPVHTPLKIVTERLTSDAGAKCLTQPNENNISPMQTICSYSHESLVGMKEFGLTGWEIFDVHWQKNKFEFVITSQNGHLISAKGEILEGECYDIDVGAYKSTKTIKFIRKIP